MGTPQNISTPIPPGTKLVISGNISYKVVETEGVAWQWEVDGPPMLLIRTRWLRPNSLKLTVPAGNSCSITIRVPHGVKPHITGCR